MSPAEQIARFVERHPGEWRARFPGDVDGDMVLETVAGGLLLCQFGAPVSVSASRRGFDEFEFYATDEEEGLPILTQAAARFGDMIQAHGGSADTLPPWLAGPVSHQLINRARTLLTSAGISPTDAVMAAETLDEALCGRPVVEPTLSAVLAALQAIGMSCRWIRDPGDTGINPEREALEDARLALSCADDEMTREQYVDLFRDLRRVLGVT